jgi:hypothetical protein
MKRTATVAILAILSTPAAADVVRVGDWRLSRMPRSCTLFATFNGGTTLSVYGTKLDEVMFTLQNHKWKSLDGDLTYKISVEFDGLGAWPITTVASRDIDGDGPGIAFMRNTETNSDGDNFIAEFARSRVMYITRNGRKVDTLNLQGTYNATQALIRCIGSRSTQDPFEESDAPARPDSVEIPISI